MINDPRLEDRIWHFKRVSEEEFHILKMGITALKAQANLIPPPNGQTPVMLGILLDLERVLNKIDSRTEFIGP